LKGAGCEADQLKGVRSREGVSLGWDPSARAEDDGPSRGQKIFQQKNICDREIIDGK